VNNNYDPRAPYAIKSGSKIGESLEHLMFIDYGWLVYMRDLLNKRKSKEKNKFHKHIEWVLERGESRQSKMLCPQCVSSPVVYFSVLGERRNGYSMNVAYTCCDDDACKQKLIAQGIEKTSTLMPIAFSSIMRFGVKRDQRQVVQILKKCFNLPKRLTKEVLFSFFKEE
jgi:hypothetical protein